MIPLPVTVPSWAIKAAVVLLLGAAAFAGGYRTGVGRESARTARVAAACEQARSEAVQEALRAQAEAWESLYTAQQEAIARMAQEAGVAAANAREWKRRFDAAKQTPACQKWAAEAIQCPVE